MKLSVVIVNYRGWKKLRLCLKSLACLNNASFDWEVIIVDNQSDDGECTLREAIIAANTNTASGATGGECIAGDAGADTIQFDITGVADFTVGLGDGYTIQPTSGLPGIKTAVTALPTNTLSGFIISHPSAY